MSELTHKEMSSMGGKGRWKNISKKARSQMMRELVGKRKDRKGKKAVIHNKAA